MFFAYLTLCLPLFFPFKSGGDLCRQYKPLEPCAFTGKELIRLTRYGGFLGKLYLLNGCLPFFHFSDDNVNIFLIKHEHPLAGLHKTFC